MKGGGTDGGPGGGNGCPVEETMLVLPTLASEEPGRKDWPGGTAV